MSRERFETLVDRLHSLLRHNPVNPQGRNEIISSAIDALFELQGEINKSEGYAEWLRKK